MQTEMAESFLLLDIYLSEWRFLGDHRWKQSQGLCRTGDALYEAAWTMP